MMGRPKTFGTLYERIVAGTREPENSNACWTWAGTSWRGYGLMSVRRPDKKSPVPMRVHRAVLEEIHAVDFPLDEGGHLCRNTLCANPDHLEVQTSYHNLSERAGNYTPRKEGRMIPVLFPRDDLLQRAADYAWDARPAPCNLEIPF